MSASVARIAVAHKVDVIVPGGLAAVDAAAWVAEAVSMGCRAITVPARLARAVKDAAGRSCKVAASCHDVSDMDRETLVLHALTKLRGNNLDELEIPVSSAKACDALWARTALRQAIALCHAHGAFANVLIPVEGMGAEEVAHAVRCLLGASANAVTLVAGPGCLAQEGCVAAALEAAGTGVGVRVAEEPWDAARQEALVSLGVQSVRVVASSEPGVLAA